MKTVRQQENQDNESENQATKPAVRIAEPLEAGTDAETDYTTSESASVNTIKHSDIETEITQTAIEVETVQPGVEVDTTQPAVEVNNSPSPKSKVVSPQESQKSPLKRYKNDTPTRTVVDSPMDVALQRLVSPALKKATRDSSPRNTRRSQKPIAGFSTLSIKEKASAFENHARHSNSIAEVHYSSSSDESDKPQKKQKLEKDTVTESPGLHIVPDSPVSDVMPNNQTDPHETYKDTNSETSDAVIVQAYPSRRSSVRKSKIRSLSNKRSSLFKHKLRTSTKMHHEILQQAVRKEAERAVEEPPVRSTRSKMRLNKKPPPALPVEDDEDEPQEATSSKVGQITSCEETDADDEDDVAIFKTPSPPKRTTRSKMRKNAPPPPSLPHPSDSEDEQPARFTRSKMRKKSVTDKAGHKRTISESVSESGSPQKRTCRTDSDSGNTSTPEKYTYRPPANVKSLLHGNTSKDFGSAHRATVVKSFIKRNTPKKKKVPTATLR